MGKDRKVSVSIYCKIYTDNFSNEMLNRKATGTEIFEFLMKDAQCCFDDNGQLIPGDCNLWYLGCNEKFGHMRYGDVALKWSFGESSFDRVEEFVSMIYRDGFFTAKQYQTLMGKIREGRLIDNMYDIRNYLVCIRNNLSWSKTKDALEFRNHMKQMIAGIDKSLKDEGYQVYH
jgi:hypothetical protein